MCFQKQIKERHEDEKVNQDIIIVARRQGGRSFQFTSLASPLNVIILPEKQLRSVRHLQIRLKNLLSFKPSNNKGNVGNRLVLNARLTEQTGRRGGLLGFFAGERPSE